MSKEQNALIGLENRINWALFKLDFRSSDAERQKRRVTKAHKQIQIIKEALKRNEPMKIKSFDPSSYYGLLGYFECPKCGETLTKGYYNYCPDCGQKFDRSDEK